MPPSATPKPPRWLPMPTRPGTERIVPALTEYIAVPAKSPMFDADWARARPTSTASCATPRPGSRAARWPGLKLEVVRMEGRTPLIFFEIPATQAGVHRHRAALRPPRQAARIQRLAQGPRPVDAQVRERPALRPRRCRRRLRGLRRHHRHRGARRAGHPAAALRGRHRGLRGKRLAPTCRPTSTRCKPRLGNVEPGGVPGQRRRQLRPALAHQQPARHGQRRAEGRDPHRRHPLGRRQRAGAVELSHPAPGARPAGGQPHRPPAARELPLRDPGLARRAGAGHGGDPEGRGLEALPLGLRRRRRRWRCPPPPIRCKPCSTAPGGPRSASPASRASPTWPAPATCCARTRPSSSACACRRWWTATRRA